jgi:hypothetical protein
MKKAIERFSIAQMTSNESGKTSASGTIGVIITLIGAICFAMGCVGVMFFTGGSEIITQSIVVIGMGATLLGYRKSQTGSKIEEQEAVALNSTEPCSCVQPCSCGNCEKCTPMLNS